MSSRRARVQGGAARCHSNTEVEANTVARNAWSEASGARAPSESQRSVPCQRARSAVVVMRLVACPDFPTDPRPTPALGSEPNRSGPDLDGPNLAPICPWQYGGADA